MQCPKNVLNVLNWWTEPQKLVVFIGMFIHTMLFNFLPAGHILCKHKQTNIYHAGLISPVDNPVCSKIQ
jgi:hypothetical protein